MIIRRGLTALTILMIGFIAACGTTNQVSYRTKYNVKQLERSKLPKFDIPIQINDRVIAWIDYFQGPGRKSFANYLSRSGRYTDLMRSVLKQYGLPQDLVYIALIESGFSHKAYSRAKAVGLWQFIRGTGSRYGLEANDWIDERRDFEKATIAAVQHFKDLYAEFGDWYLAMAAYNAGEGKIKKAVDRAGTKNFWVLIERDGNYLRAETKDYVPKFIAAAIIAKSPERFGFTDVVYEKPLEFELASVAGPTDVDVISKCAGISLEEVELFNPELVRGITPDIKSYKIRLPIGSAKRFDEAYASVPPEERITTVRYTVKKGDSAARIAKRYGVTVRALLAANNLEKKSSVKAGRTLIIPTGKTKLKLDTVVAENKKEDSTNFIKHKVRKGETLNSIAKKYGASVASIKRWNKMSSGAIHKGQLLKIYSSSEAVALNETKEKSKNGNSKFVYTVKRGDSWSRIAQKYGVSINDIQIWNPKYKGKLLAGSKLKIFDSQAATQTLEAKTVSAPPSAEEKAVGPSSSAAPETVKSVALATPVTASEKAELPIGQTAKPVQAKDIANVSHKILSGETVWDIAQKYNVSVADIMTWNNLTKQDCKKLRAGDVIKLQLASN